MTRLESYIRRQVNQMEKMLVFNIHPNTIKVWIDMFNENESKRGDKEDWILEMYKEKPDEFSVPNKQQLQ